MGLIRNCENISRHLFHVKCILVFSHVKILLEIVQAVHDEVYTFSIESFHVVKKYTDIELELSIPPIQPSYIATRAIEQLLNIPSCDSAATNY